MKTIINNTIDKNTKKTHKKFKNSSKYNKLNNLPFLLNKKTLLKDIIITKPLNIKELSIILKIQVTNLMNYINNLKILPEIKSITHILDINFLTIILEDLGYKVYINTKYISIKDIIDQYYNKTYYLYKKTIKIPVVTILGHVDHGKTTLLDYIRSSRITELEIGQITQKIGAYYVKTLKGNITFLDTPGHEIFNLMRVRGIQVSDIIIIMIAANDGIQPQTIEVIQYALKYKLPIIVAINKIDLVDNTIIQNIKNDLLNYNIIDTSLGGDTLIINISAKSGIGINNLLDSIILKRDNLQLYSSYEGMVIATVIESSVDKHLGPLTTILIENGTLHKGDIVICGNTYGKIKHIKDEYFNNINVGYPSMPIQILGLYEPPIVGERLITVSTEKEAKSIISLKKKYDILNNNLLSHTTINNEKIHITNLKHINIIIKTDSYSSLEVIANLFDSLNNQHKDKIKFKIIHRGLGDINETDIILSQNTKAKLIGFNIEIDKHVQHIMKYKKLDIKIYNLVYNLIKDLKSYLNLLLNINNINTQIGKALVKNIYKLPSSSRQEQSIIIGCKIIEGYLKTNCYIQIYREDIIIYKGNLQSLRRFKNDVDKVQFPMECGISIKNFTNINIGDIVIAYNKNLSSLT